MTEDMAKEKELTLHEKAKRYDEIMEMRRKKAIKASMSVDAETRKANAKKAIEARWAKYRAEKESER